MNRRLNEDSLTGTNGFANWNLNAATTFYQMFREATIFNGDIGGWVFSTDINKSHSAQAMFMNASSFNQDISSWNVGRFISMKSMFQSATVFNQNILSWNVENVTNMAGMFNAAVAFNQDISTWNTSKVTIMNSMFQNAMAFNQDISTWNTSKVTIMNSMFQNATAFNNDISNWDVSNVTNMSSMFNNAMAFNQDISTWNISKVTTLQNFLLNGKLSRANYDALLLGWSTLDAGETLVPTNLKAHFGSSKYSNTASVLTARNNTLVTAKTWTVTDGGMDSDVIVPYIVSNTLAADNTTITITFSENVYRTDVASGSLEATDFLFSLTGGTATLNTTIPSSISFSNNLTFVLGIDINGTPDGTEVLTVTPVLNSIFDISGNAAATTQSNNTVYLKDFKPPIITGPNSATGVSSSISMNENTAAVHTFSANKAVSWSKGSTYDGGLFNIDINGNLVFITAPDYETPSSTLNSNTYVVDVIATDAASSATTQTLTITILDIPATTFGTFASVTKQYFAGPHTISAPTTNNSNAIVYTSDNTAVATVSGSVITFTGVGTANITATQAADANYEGNAVSTLLTVLGKDLVSKYGGISSTNVNYISANGSVGGALGLDKYGKQEYVSDAFISSGLVMHLDAGNAASYPGSGTTWTDISGNGKNGTLVNGPTYNSSNRGSIVFDGTDDYVNCGNPLLSSGKITVSAWVKITTGSKFQHIVDCGADAWHLAILNDNRPYFYNGSSYHTNAAILTVGQWYMITGIQGTTLDIYINGVLSQSIASNVNVSNNTLNMGRWQNSTRYLTGNIAQVSIYNRALSAAEVLHNFNSTKSVFGL